VNWFTAHLMSQYAKVDAVNKEHIDKLYLEFNKRWKDIIISRNAEIEAKDRTITDLQKLSSEHVSYLSELSKKETEIEALKAQIELMRSQIKTVRQILTGVKSNMWEETINEAARQLDKEN